jgi:predicted DNA-binding transcriptional regulator AlpA
MKAVINLLDKEPLVSPADVAKILGVEAKTVAEWARKYRDFPAVRLPGVVRMRLSEVATWLEQFQSRPRPRTRAPREVTNA